MRRRKMGNPSKRPDENRRINKHTLIRIFKAFKLKPLKVFALRDFNATNKNFRGKYLHTLKVLDLIEEVPAIYYSGKKETVCRNVIGYRLKYKNSSVCKNCGYINKNDKNRI